MSYDKIEKTKGTLIQHGPSNDRVYLMKCNKRDPKISLKLVEEIAEKQDYGKIFAKIPAEYEEIFKENDFDVEARVPRFFNGKQDGLFLSKYRDENRASINEKRIDHIIETARSKETLRGPSINHQVRELGFSDTKEITEIYRQVFDSYPFPIFEEAYIKECLDSHVRMFGIEESGELVSIASCEIDFNSENVEMTDFATIPKARGNGYAHSLLHSMDQEMKEAGIKTAYTIARAASPAMNITFSKSGYEFSGTLKNNTDISGQIESMNVWYRKL